MSGMDDPAAVLDPELRVKGGRTTAHSRCLGDAIDHSRGHTMAPVVDIAEHACKLICDQRRFL